MHLLLTDRLACPRCGPEFGLILLADRLAERRVYEGTLGCPNCRDAFGVRDGFADLRAPPRDPLSEGLAGAAPPPDDDGGVEAAGGPGEAGRPQDPAGTEKDVVGGDEAQRLRALLDLHRGPGTVALVGGPARLAGWFVTHVPDLDVVVVDPDVRHWPERAGVSRMVSAPGLPFFSGRLRGVVVDGRLGPAMVFEAARVTAPRCRTVVVEAREDAGAVLEEAGLEILAADGETVVAARS